MSLLIGLILFTSTTLNAVKLFLRASRQMFLEPKMPKWSTQETEALGREITEWRSEDGTQPCKEMW